MGMLAAAWVRVGMRRGTQPGQGGRKGDEVLGGNITYGVLDDGLRRGGVHTHLAGGIH